jgi:hypothetical protein
MRVFIATFFLLSGFALSAQKTATVASEKAIQEGVSTGLYNFTFPEELGKEEITKVGSYYEQYFSVNVSEGANKVSLKLAQNDVRSRMVVMRFLTANGIERVVVGSKELSIEEFNTIYLK